MHTSVIYLVLDAFSCFHSVLSTEMAPCTYLPKWLPKPIRFFIFFKILLDEHVLAMIFDF